MSFGTANKSVLLFCIRITANIYSHLDFSSRVESAETIANILGDAESGMNNGKNKPVKETRGRKKKNSDKTTDSAETN